jgi:hypothetical protein
MKRTMLMVLALTALVGCNEVTPPGTGDSKAPGNGGPVIAAVNPTVTPTPAPPTSGISEQRSCETSIIVDNGSSQISYRIGFQKTITTGGDVLVSCHVAQRALGSSGFQVTPQASAANASCSAVFDVSDSWTSNNFGTWVFDAVGEKVTYHQVGGTYDGNQTSFAGSDCN